MPNKLPPGAIAHKDDLDEDALAGKHIDGETGFVFETEADYIAFKHPEETKDEEAKPEKEPGDETL